MESKESIHTYPGEMTENRKHSICGKITKVLRDEACSVGQALELLEATKEHILKYIVVSSKNDYNDEFRKMIVDKEIGK